MVISIKSSFCLQLTVKVKDRPYWPVFCNLATIDLVNLVFDRISTGCQRLLSSIHRISETSSGGVGTC